MPTPNQPEPFHVQALGRGHTPTWDCICEPIHSELLGRLVVIHRPVPASDVFAEGEMPKPLDKPMGAE